MDDDFLRSFASGAASLKDQQDRLTALRDKAEQAKKDLATTVVTVSSSDQSVTIGVGAGGVMQSLRFGPRADRLPLTALSSTIMSTYAQACREAAERAASIVDSFAGAGSETSALLRESVPADPAADGSDRRR